MGVLRKALKLRREEVKTEMETAEYTLEELEQIADEAEQGKRILTQKEIDALCFSEEVEAVWALCAVAESHRQLLKLYNSFTAEEAKPDIYLDPESIDIFKSMVQHDV